MYVSIYLSTLSSKIIPVVKKRHLLLVTLLLCNAAAMEALPIFLDKMVSPAVAIIVSVTAVLFFGEYVLLAFLHPSLCSIFSIYLLKRGISHFYPNSSFLIRKSQYRYAIESFPRQFARAMD